MPFKVRYDIYEPNKQAPCIQTFDRMYAWAELNDRQRKPGMALTRMTTTVIPEELTKSERYLYLVYQVRSLQKRYWANGKQHDDLLESLAKEKELDNRNTKIRYHLETHPKYRIDDQESFAFFQIVEAWRDKWKHYFAYKRQQNKDDAVQREMYKECRDYEAKIDEYIKKTIGL